MAEPSPAAASAPAGIPYIGSLIILTSKMLVRYEGVLCDINPGEATVKLQNVRCFGTEDRLPSHQAIPASEDIFDFIVFRGSDIKDLQVRPPVTDPAIISFQKKSPAESHAVEASNSRNENYNRPAFHNSNHEIDQQRGWRSRNPNHSHQQRHPYPDNEDVNRGSLGSSQFAHRPAPPLSVSEIAKGDYDIQSANAKFTRVFEEMKRDLPTAVAPAAAAVSDASSPAALADSAVPISVVVPVPVAPKYNKKSSFFDDISTARDERDRSNVSRQQLRQTNVETFGAQPPGPLHVSSRGGRDRGGRGGREDHRAAGQGYSQERSHDQSQGYHNRRGGRPQRDETRGGRSHRGGSQSHSFRDVAVAANAAARE